MEWVETTAPTIEEAKDAALDRLGVDETDAEFEILEEPQRGLFGRLRREARVRARVRPTRPRGKNEQRERRRRSRGNGGGSGGGERSRRSESSGRAAGGASNGGRRRSRSSGSGGEAGASGSRTSAARHGERAGDASVGSGGAGGNGRRRSEGSPGSGSPGSGGSDARNGGKRAGDGAGDKEAAMSPAAIDEQQDAATAFLEGLLGAFGVGGSVSSTRVDDDTLALAVEGDDLGLLIGPKGATLSAVQDLMRTAAQRRSDGPTRVRLRLDIGGYRERRREALERFTRKVAEEVLESGTAKALEPMSAPDRKVVHDTVNEIEGVRTISEGEDDDRRVVIVPA